jgi:hypothetical protein
MIRGAAIYVISPKGGPDMNDAAFEPYFSWDNDLFFKA